MIARQILIRSIGSTVDLGSGISTFSLDILLCHFQDLRSQRSKIDPREMDPRSGSLMEPKYMYCTVYIWIFYLLFLNFEMLDRSRSHITLGFMAYLLIEELPTVHLLDQYLPNLRGG